MMRYAAFLIGLVFFSCAQPPKPASLTEQEAIDVIKKFDEAWKNKNLAGVDSVLSPIYVYFTQSGGTFIRDSVVATAGEASYYLQDVNRSEFSAQVYDNTAIVSTRWKGKGSYRGNPFDEDQRCSVVVIKEGDRVQILTEHCTPVKSVTVFH